MAFLAGPLAHGQPATPQAQAALADTAYEEGRRLYDLREWDQAIGKFKEAYRIRPDAKSLFNIAQAFRLKGDCVEAVNFYRTYKRNFPQEKNIGKADKFISELEPCPKVGAVTPDPIKPDPKPTKPVGVPVKVTQPEPVQPEPVRPQPVSNPATPVQPRAERSGTTQRTSAVGIGAVGALFVAGGLYYGLKSSSLARDAEAGNGVWDPGLEERGNAAARNAKLLLGIGTATLITGIVVYVIAPHGKKQPSVGFVPTSDGAVVVWTGKL